MNDGQVDVARALEAQWLKQYYFSRAGFSVVWVALAFAIGQHSPGFSAVLFVIYPAWDALANYVDMTRSGGAAFNRTQAFNVAMSGLTTLAVIVALKADTPYVLDVFGVWAIVSGLLQLGTAVRRWKSFGAQWAMILSGAQSALAGVLFIVQAHSPAQPAILKVAGYAGVGALYFLISAVWLWVGQRRRQAARV